MKGTFAIVTIIILFTSCKEQTSNGSTFPEYRSGFLTSFADEIEKHVLNSDTLSLIKHIKINKEVEIKTKEEIGELHSQLATNLIALSKSFSNTSYFNLIKQYKTKDSYHLIFECYSRVFGLNFVDIELSLNHNKFYITDYFDYFTGKPFSDIITTYLSNKRDKNYYLSINQFEMAKRSLFYLDYEGAYEIMNAIPDKYKYLPKYYAFRLYVAKNISDDLYLNDLKIYVKKNSSYRFKSLIKFKISMYEYEIEEAKKRLAELDNVVGECPLIIFEKGNIFSLKEDYNLAAKKYSVVIRRSPDFILTYFYHAVSNIHLNLYEMAVSDISAIERRFSISREHIHEYFDFYDDFVKSDPYVEWYNGLDAEWSDDNRLRDSSSGKW